MEMEMEMEMTGLLAVEKICGKSTVTRSFSKYPLKFIVPNKVSSSCVDAVWVYTLSYGGGIVSGDCISCSIIVGEDCTLALTTQASTKVYKSLPSCCSQQHLEARIGRNATLAIIPHPVTCFSSARYAQKQVFKLSSDSNLILVDWLTSGRHESGERWQFNLYKSINHIFLEDSQPLFLDTVLLEHGPFSSIAEKMQDYQVIAMVILIGPKLKQVQDLIVQTVKNMMSAQFYAPKHISNGYLKKLKIEPYKPSLLASCSAFGPKAMGVVVRIAAVTTESVFEFLSKNLAGLEPLLGASPYC